MHNLSEEGRNTREPRPKRNSNLLTPEEGYDVRFMDILKLFLLQLLIGFVLMLFVRPGSSDDAQIIVTPINNFIFLLLYLRFGFWPGLAEFGITGENLRQGLKLGIAAGVVTQALAVGVGFLLRALLGPWATWAEIPDLEPVSTFAWLSFAFVVVVMAPLIEELTVRGIIYGSIRHKYGKRWALVASSLLFSLMHGINPVSLGVILVPGMVLALLYEREQSLAVPVIAHSAFNFVALVVHFIGSRLA